MVVNSDGADGVDGVDGSVSGGVIPWQTGRLLQSSVYRVLSLISFLLRPPISVSGGGLSQDKVLLSCAREREREREGGRPGERAGPGLRPEVSWLQPSTPTSHCALGPGHGQISSKSNIKIEISSLCTAVLSLIS